MAEELSHSDLANASRDELKELCKRHGLPVSGNKNTLMVRLHEFFESNVTTGLGGMPVKKDTGPGSGDVKIPGVGKEPDVLFRAKLNVNTATKEEFRLWPGITGSLATAIIDHRKNTGTFKSVDELLKVKGIGQNRLDQIRPVITLTGSTALEPVNLAKVVRSREELKKMRDSIAGITTDLGNKNDQLRADLKLVKEKKDSISRKEKTLQEDARSILKMKDNLKGLRGQLKKRETQLNREFQAKVKRLKSLNQKVTREKFALDKEREHMEEVRRELEMTHRKARMEVLRQKAALDYRIDGRININTATAEELSLWPHFPPRIIKGIIKYRKK